MSSDLRNFGQGTVFAAIQQFLERKDKECVSRLVSHLETAQAWISALYQEFTPHFLNRLGDFQISLFHIRKLYAYGVGNEIGTLAKVEEKERHRVDSGLRDCAMKADLSLSQ